MTATVFIKSISIENFRCIKGAQFTCERLTALVGRNGSGKSTILSALDVFYNTAAPVTAEDFFGRLVEEPIVIRVSYGNLAKAERDEFSSFVVDGDLTVTKKIWLDDGKPIQKYFASSLQIPQMAAIRSLENKRDRISEFKKLQETGNLPGLSANPRSADEVELAMKAYETEHPEFTKPVDREEQFFGPRNIGGGKLDKFTRFVLVPAVREAAEEATDKRGSVYQLLDIIVMRELEARQDLADFNAKYGEELKRLYSSANLKELPRLGDLLSVTLRLYAPGSRLNLSWDEMQVPEVNFPPARATLVEDNFEGDIGRKGHGLQRALILSLLHQLAVLKPTVNPGSPAAAADRSPTSNPVAPRTSPELILAIEEPELYLHPSRCRYLAEVLMNLAEPSGEIDDPKNQILYTTHSPHFVGLDQFDRIRLVRKVPGSAGEAQRTNVSSYSLEAAAKVLEMVCLAKAGTYNRDSFKVRAVPVMTAVVNEGFFADTVVVVEGATEVSALWRLQALLKKDWEEHGIVVIPVGGINNIDRPVVAFRGLGIPVFFIFDADHRKQNTAEEKKARERNQRLIRLSGASLSDFPDTTVGRDFAVLKTDLEGEFEDAMGAEKTRELVKKVADNLGYDTPARALKNPEVCSRFVESAYAAGGSFPSLERIVDAITALRGN